MNKPSQQARYNRRDFIKAATALAGAGILTKIEPAAAKEIADYEALTYNKTFDLSFVHSLDDGVKVLSDTFHAIGSDDPAVQEGLDSYDVRQQPPFPANDYVEAKTQDTGTDLTKDVKPHPGWGGSTDLKWLIKLVAYDDAYVGFDGTSYFDLDPSSLVGIPDDVLVVMTRYDKDGNAVQNYNLKDNPNIQWPVTQAKNIHSTLDLKVIDEFQAVAKLAPGENRINFKHYATLVNSMNKIGPFPGDINHDNVTDMKDVAIVFKYWLQPTS